MKRKTPKAEPASASQNLTVRPQRDKLDAIKLLSRRKGVTASAIVQLAIADMLEREAAKASRLSQ